MFKVSSKVAHNIKGQSYAQTQQLTVKLKNWEKTIKL